ncbi:hypothetical protein [Pseudomonas nitroreducens]|uniref:hypothetical protein n=1 Tax=Pseudomonas nitroreducens TaxID=46680 RepID=UPI003CC829A2
MSRKVNKRLMTETQIVSQESRIPDIALKAFNDAYKRAIASGASVLVAKDGHLYKVDSDSEISIGLVEGYGSLKSGTRLRIKKNLVKAAI